jgi:hypothetical protein
MCKATISALKRVYDAKAISTRRGVEIQSLFMTN